MEHDLADRFAEVGVEPRAFAMIGNSLRSDIVPVVALGGCGVHMPYHVTWAHETETAPPVAFDRIRTVDGPAGLPAAIRALAAG